VTRERLPNRRPHELLDFEHGGFRFTGGIGRNEDGRLAEVFLNCSKVGTRVDVNARDAAIVASLALQHGATTDELRRALTRNGDGSAGGPLAAVLDLVEGDAP
jgi:ribonucleoside-diphosphate reductase alpha chain